MYILSALLAGAVYAAAPGPIGVETLRQGMRGGFKSALAVQGGSAIGLLFYAALALAGASALQQPADWQPVFNLVAMALLVALGLGAIRRPPALPDLAAGSALPARRALASGALLSLASPLDLLFWLSLGGSFLQQQQPQALASLAAFAAGCLLASLAVACFAALCHARLNASQRLTPRVLHAVSGVCGLALIAFGLHLGLGAAAQIVQAEQTNYRISDPLLPDGYVSENHLSPDQQFVLYTAWSASTQTEDLYLAPIDASSAPRRLNDPLQPDHYVWFVAVTPDGARAVYLQSAPIFGPNELYMVPLDGSAGPLRLNGTLPTGSDGVRQYRLSPDGAYVVFLAQLDDPDVHELYSMPVDGSSPPLKLNGPLAANGNVDDFLISPDSSRVVFRADYRADEVYELGSVPIDGSTLPVRLNGPLVSDGDVQVDYAISPDGARVVFRADALVDDVYQIASVPIDRSQPPVRLNEPLVAGGDVDDFLVSPDGNRVIFRADFQTDDVDELLSAPIDGRQPPVRLNDDLGSWGDVSGRYEITPDSSRVIFVADKEDDSLYELFSAPSDGSQPPQKLNAPLVEGGIVYHFRISPDGARVVYSADQDTDEIVELYSLLLDSSAPPRKLNAPLEASSDVYRVFNFSADSQYITYIANHSGEAQDLYLVSAAGAIAPIRINPPLVENGEVNFLNEATAAEVVDAPGQSLRVLYYADQESDEVDELFATHITPPELSFITDAAEHAESGAVAGIETVVTTTVQLQGPALAPVQVEFTLSGDAAAGADYLLSPATLAFAPGETTQTLEITILHDDEVEDDETLTISLHNPQNAVLASPETFTLTIVDDDYEGDDGDDPGDDPAPYTFYIPLFTNDHERQ